jgi:hypothetical protein
VTPFCTNTLRLRSTCSGTTSTALDYPSSSAGRLCACSSCLDELSTQGIDFTVAIGCPRHKNNERIRVFIFCPLVPLSIYGVACMQDTATLVALATLAFLSYRLLFCSDRELSIAAMLFCCACAWCIGQLSAAALGEHTAVESQIVLTWLQSACNNSMLSESARRTCCKYSTWFASSPECDA